MKFPSNILIVLIAVLLMSACSVPDVKLRGVRPADTVGPDGKSAYTFSIDNPALSHDGRYMAFDFHEYGRKGKRSVRTHLKIGIYNLQSQSIEILDTPHKNQELHSPSFDHSGNQLVMIGTCVETGCPRSAWGSQVYTYNLISKKFTQITNIAQKIGSLGFFYGSSKTYKVEREFGTSVVRGYPVFSTSGDRIYYTANAGAKLSSIFWMQFNPDYWINYLDLNATESRFLADDRLLQDKDDDVVIFRGDGHIAVLGPTQIIYSGYRGLGRNYKIHKERFVQAYYYDTGNNTQTVAFDKNNVPAYSKNTEKYHYPLRSITASHDGAKIAVVRGDRNIVAIWEDGEFRDAVMAHQLGIKTISHIAFSGKGNSLVIFPYYLDPLTKVDHFWLMNVENGNLKKLPFRSLLRNANSKEHNA